MRAVGTSRPRRIVLARSVGLVVGLSIGLIVFDRAEAWRQRVMPVWLMVTVVSLSFLLLVVPAAMFRDPLEIGLVAAIAPLIVGGVAAKVFEPDRWLEEGDQVTVGELIFDVYHCPGHTPGHVIFHHPPSKLALVGDVLFQGSIGRTDFPMGNHQDLIDAIVTKLWPLGDDTAFIPGHGPMSSFGQERRTNPFVGERALAG